MGLRVRLMALSLCPVVSSGHVRASPAAIFEISWQVAGRRRPSPCAKSASFMAAPQISCRAPMASWLRARTEAAAPMVAFSRRSCFTSGPERSVWRYTNAVDIKAYARESSFQRGNSTNRTSPALRCWEQRDRVSARRGIVTMAQPRKKLPERSVDVFCQKCKAQLYKYKKGGKGSLVKCFKERIVQDFTGGQLECPSCGQEFAREVMVRGKPAFKMIGGKVYQKK